MEIKHSYANGTVSGTTTSAYVEALTLTNCAGVIFNIRGDTSTATMYYKIDTYLSASSTCTAVAAVAATGLAGSSAVTGLITTVNYPNAKIVVSVVQNSGAGAYKIDWISY